MSEAWRNKFRKQLAERHPDLRAVHEEKAAETSAKSRPLPMAVPAKALRKSRANG